VLARTNADLLTKITKRSTHDNTSHGSCTFVLFMLRAKSCRLRAQANIAAVFGAQGTVKQLYDVAELYVFIFPNPLDVRSDA